MVGAFLVHLPVLAAFAGMALVSGAFVAGGLLFHCLVSMMFGFLVYVKAMCRCCDVLDREVAARRKGASDGPG